jgi:hypothetical protein
VPVSTCEALTNIALALREKVGLPPHQLYRLVGVGLTNFQFDDDVSSSELPQQNTELLLRAQQSTFALLG